MNPYFSIIVPVYNVERYLNRCVQSLLKQECLDCEIILVDDGSTDASGVICNRWSEKSELIQVYHKENGGLASARNYGLEKAKGQYIIFCDSDDWLEEGALVLLRGILQKSGGVDILKYGFKKYNSGTIIKEIFPFFPEGIYEKQEIADVIIPGMLGPEKVFDYSQVPVLSAWSCAYSKRFLDETGIIFLSEREYLNEDELFNIRLILKAERVQVIHDTLYCYDTRDGSLTQKYMPYMLEKKKKLLARIEEELKVDKVFEQYTICFYNYCVDNFYECVGHECCFNPAENKLTVKNIRHILDEDLCVSALKNCNHSRMSFKSAVTYFLFRYKLAHAILLAYRGITGRDPKKRKER